MLGLGLLIAPVRALLSGLQDAIAPQTCVVCGEWITPGSASACGGCAGQLAEMMRASWCPRCGRTMPPVAIDARGCARCKHEAFWNVAGVARVGAYELALRSLVTGLKYRGRSRNAEFMAHLLAEVTERLGWVERLDALVPVPMHRIRRWQRPCDHTELLTAALARRVGVPVLRAVRRVKHTPSQTRATSRMQRFANVKGCFAPRGRLARGLVDKSVCVVDNLLATGATVHEMSKVLRKAGARRIYAAVISRTVLAGDVQAATGRAAEGDPQP